MRRPSRATLGYGRQNIQRPRDDQSTDQPLMVADWAADER
jgi:hypothetical protein